MKYLTWASLCAAFLAAGCQTQVPLNSVTPAPGAVCTSCGPAQAVPAIAITRPGLCNDYPVAYRVQTPEIEPRVRPVDRVELSSTAITDRSVSVCQR